MQTYFIAGCAVLLLLGAGCATSNEDSTGGTTTPAVKQAGSDTINIEGDTEADNTSDTPINGDIRLTATPTNDSSVSFAWEIGADAEYDGFIIVRSLEPNPEHSGKNYWFRQHPTRRSVTWTPLPTGEWNFRICGLINNECADYSNNVTATIQ